MYGDTDYRVGLGIDFEIHMRELLSTFSTPVGGIKSRGTRREEYRKMAITPDLLFETNGFRFHVDCHYRTSMPHAYVELDYPGIYRLKEKCFSDVRHPIFVAYGIGGDPYHPDWMVFEPKENLHGRRMTKSRFLKLDRKLSALSFYNIIYQYRMREVGFADSRLWSDYTVDVRERRLEGKQGMSRRTTRLRPFTEGVNNCRTGIRRSSHSR